MKSYHETAICCREASDYASISSDQPDRIPAPRDEYGEHNHGSLASLSNATLRYWLVKGRGLTIPELLSLQAEVDRRRERDRSLMSGRYQLCHAPRRFKDPAYEAGFFEGRDAALSSKEVAQ